MQIKHILRPACFIIFQQIELTACNLGKKKKKKESVPVCVFVCVRVWGRMWTITHEIYCDFMPVLVKLMISQENIAFLPNNTFQLKYANTWNIDRWHHSCSRLSSHHWCHCSNTAAITVNWISLKLHFISWGFLIKKIRRGKVAI